MRRPTRCQPHRVDGRFSRDMQRSATASAVTAREETRTVAHVANVQYRRKSAVEERRREVYAMARDR